jgi:hypothetical protein
MGLRGPIQIADRTLLLTTAYPIYDDFWVLAKGGRRGIVREQSAATVVLRGLNLPPEPGTVIALLEATQVNQIRAICRKSAWMAKQPRAFLTNCLPKLAQQFLDAKRDSHYPRSARESSIPKKFWFLARALAGAMYGLSPRRSINIIGPGRPEVIFDRLSPEYAVRHGAHPKRSHKPRQNKSLA